MTALLLREIFLDQGALSQGQERSTGMQEELE